MLKQSQDAAIMPGGGEVRFQQHRRSTLLHLLTYAADLAVGSVGMALLLRLAGPTDVVDD